MTFTNSGRAEQGPGYRVEPVTKNDSTNLPGGVCRALLVGTAGTCNMFDASGVERTAVPLQQGYNPIGAMRVKTGGTADDIWALY
jgi:hypothetical protein